MTLEEECKEMLLYFNHRVLESLLKATKTSLDLYKKHLFYTRSADKDYIYKQGILQVLATLF